MSPEVVHVNTSLSDLAVPTSRVPHVLGRWQVYYKEDLA